MLTKKDILLSPEEILEVFKKHYPPEVIDRVNLNLKNEACLGLAKASALHALEVMESYYEKEWGVHDFEIKKLIEELKE